MKLSRMLFRFINKKQLTPAQNRKCVGKFFFYTTLVFFSICAIRIGKIEVTGKVHETSLKEKTDELYLGLHQVKARRGTIFDRCGNVIAEDTISYSVKAILSKTYVTSDQKEKLYVQNQDFQRVADVLHKNLGCKKSDVVNRLEEGERKGLYQIEFGEKGSGLTLKMRQLLQNKFKKLKIEGIQFTEHPSRNYPNGQFASHLIGYTKKSADDEGITGAFGIEAALEATLSGRNGKVAFEKDISGNVMPKTEKILKKSVDGKDIYTTIDLRLQTYLETLMDKINKQQKPENMTAMLMSAKTGEILAMSQRPSFNPETKAGLKDKKMNWKNIPIQDNYEPGSTMKTFTTAAAINENKFNPNETYLAGTTRFHDTTINDWDINRAGPHTLTFLQGLAHSSNVAMVHLFNRLGQEKWNKYQRKFGFGQFVNNGIGDNSYGSLPNPSMIVDMAMSTFGQGINVTGLQMMRGFTAIANDGKLLEPHLISKIVNPNTNQVRVVEPEILGQPISAHTAKQLREYLEQTVKDPIWGVGYYQEKHKPLYDVPGVDLAVKTGTAEIAIPNGHGYIKDNYLHSVVMMAPAKDPEFVIYVTIKLPKHEQPEMIADIANPVLKRALEAQNQESSRAEMRSSEEVTIANYCGESWSWAEEDARKNILQPTVIGGDGKKVIAQSIREGTKVLPNSRIILRVAGKMQMPDITYWGKADLDKLADIMHLKIKYDGEGKNCVKQSIEPFTDISEGTTVKVKMG